MIAFLRPINAALHERLKQLGFRRRNNTWNRRSDPYIDVVEIQLTKSQERVWVNLAVVDPYVYQQIWGRSLGAFIIEPAGTVRTRLGPLYSDVDESWAVDDPGAAGEIWTKLEGYGLPFLEGTHTPSSMIEYLRGRRGLVTTDLLGLAVLLHADGRQPAACEVLTDLRRRPLGGWAERVQELDVEFGCSDIR